MEESNSSNRIDVSDSWESLYNRGIIKCGDYKMTIKYSKKTKSVTDKILLPLTKYEPQMNLAWPTNVLKEKMKTVDPICVIVTEEDEIHLELNKLSYKLDSQPLSEQKEMEFFSTLMPILEEIESQEWDLDSDYLLKNFHRLEQTCKDAYICYETAHVAVAYLIPKLQTPQLAHRRRLDV